jgi:NADH:ubiquinone oxidoreductase subunit E
VFNLKNYFNVLTEEEIKEIKEEIKQYPYPSVACIDALKIIQRHR